MKRRALITVACASICAMFLSFSLILPSYAQPSIKSTNKSRAGSASYNAIKAFLNKEFVAFKKNPRWYDPEKRTYVSIHSIKQIGSLTEFLKKMNTYKDASIILAIFNRKAYYASGGRVGALTEIESSTVGGKSDGKISLHKLYGIQPPKSIKDTFKGNDNDRRIIKSLENQFNLFKVDRTFPKFHQYKNFASFKDVLVSFTKKISITTNDGILLDFMGEYAFVFSNGEYGMERRKVPQEYHVFFPFKRFSPYRAEKDLLNLYKIQGTIKCIRCDTYDL